MLTVLFDREDDEQSNLCEYEIIEEECRIVLDGRWVSHGDIKAVKAGEGVMRRVLAYSKDSMCVENTFGRGAVGSLHHHPHIQITYMVSGGFELSIEGEKRIVKVGDTILRMDGVGHGCACPKTGILLDIFTPMREDFV